MNILRSTCLLCLSHTWSLIIAEYMCSVLSSLARETHHTSSWHIWTHNISKITQRRVCRRDKVETHLTCFEFFSFPWNSLKSPFFSALKQLTVNKDKQTVLDTSRLTYMFCFLHLYGTNISYLCKFSLKWSLLMCILDDTELFPTWSKEKSQFAVRQAASYCK